MDLQDSPAEARLRRELRSYFAALMTPRRRAGVRSQAQAGGGDYGDGEMFREVVGQLGRDGWLALGWPEEYGGQGRTAQEQLIFVDEAAIAGVPVPFLTLNTVGPTIMAFGTPEQKAFFLPRIARGELQFAIGYSEPGAGTDLAALSTRAVRDETGYTINGQKMWTSLIQYADYVWLACRTDQDAVKHRGLSVLIVPTTAEGFSWTPVPTMAGPTTSATYYKDVRVGLDALVGQEHRGWKLITNQLNHERVALTSAAPMRHALQEVTDWARQAQQPDGSALIEAEWVRLTLARVHAKVEAMRLMNARTAWRTDQGGALGPADASATKVYGTELATEVYRLLMEVVGTAAVVRTEAAGAVVGGMLERLHRSSLILTFGGGTNEVQRDILAATALSVPVGSTLMDFTHSPELEELTDLVRQICTDLVSPERLRDLGAGADRHDGELWAALVKADVPEAMLSTEDGLGLQACCAVLEQAGRVLAPVRLREAVAVAGWTLARHGSPQQQDAWVQPLLRGELLLTAAPGSQVVTINRDDAGAVVNGTLDVVAAGPGAAVLVGDPRSGDAVLIALTDPGAHRQAQAVVDGNEATRLQLDSVRVSVDRLVPGAAADLRRHAVLAACAEQLGVLEGGLRQTAAYSGERTQFGRPIGSFQAVSQRLADGWIAIEAARLTLWGAIWSMSSHAVDPQGQTAHDVEAAVAAAAYWACEAGHQVAHTCVHVHGGTGIDVSHPIHRYFTAAKRIEFELGGATRQLLALGQVVPDLYGRS